jgi:uroporphyrinogen decarboxylase
MNRRERFLAALRLEQPDRVPLFDFLFQQPLYETLIGHKPEGYNGADAVKCALALDHDGVWLPFGGFSGYQPKYLKENVYQDEWGTTYQKEPSSWPIDAPIDYPIKRRDDLKGYVAPDPMLPGRTAEIVAARDMDNDNIALLGGVQGPLTTAWLLMGYENISFALYDDPDLLTEVFKISNEFFKEAARLSVEAGCVGIWVSEDLGDSSRGFFRLPHYRKYILPPFVELVEYVANLGVPVLLHACGCITDYLPDIAQTKVTSVHPLQRTAGMDLKWVKETYGKRFAIVGTPDEVEAEVREAIEVAGKGGGYVLASDHSLHDGIPVENILRMFEAGKKYGRYEK